MSNFLSYPSYKASLIEWLYGAQIPSHWKEAPLRFLARMRSGDAITAESIEEDGPYRVYGANGMRGYGELYNTSGEKVLIGRVGALCGNIHLVRGDFFASEHALVTTPLATANIRWLSKVLEVMNLGQYSRAAAQPVISAEVLSKLKLPTPPLFEQEAIADFLDQETAEIDAFIADQEELIALLHERRSATITQAVTKGLDSTAAMKDSGVEWLGKVPEEWVVGAIKHLALRITDGAHISPETEGGVYDFVSTRDVSASGIDFEGALKTSPSTYEYMVRTGCQPQVGDVLFSKDGTVGRTVVVRSANPFVIASSLIIIRPNPAHLNSGFLDYTCQSRAIQEQVRSYVKGAGLPRLSISNLSKIVAAFPSLSEQEEIAAYLDHETGEIDAAIADAREAIELSKERRAALISAAVTGKIDVRNRITAELGAA